VLDWDGYTIGYYGRPFEARNKARVLRLLLRMQPARAPLRCYCCCRCAERV
jgi:hypothetical protein